MSQPFEGLQTVPTADEVVDQAFSRAARAGRAKSGIEGQRSMLQTAANIISDNLQHVVTDWPDLDDIDPFYRELADAAVEPPAEPEVEEPIGGVDDLRMHLNEVGWAGGKATDIRDEYMSRLTGDAETARKLRKQAFARLADVVDEVEDSLAALSTARETLRVLPDIRPEEPTVVVAGYPNVGKSSFVNHVTRADNETATYPFTTTAVHVGHLDRDHITYQFVDTPGLLDRPPEERNAVESQAVSALEHAADAVLFVVDASGECGYPLDAQVALRDAVAERFDEPVLTVCNKRDRSTDVTADYYMSVTEDENLEEVVDAIVAAVDYEPELPYDGT